MSELKFRAWDKIDKVMVFEFFISSTGDVLTKAPKRFNHSNHEIKERDYLNVMQYTGIKDVNGVEIYVSYAVQTCESDYSQIGVIKFGRFESSHESGYSRGHYHYGFYIENEAGQVFGNCGEDVDMDKLTVIGEHFTKTQNF